jgi:3-methyladenine DNA glycosylase AlkD
LAIYVDSVDKWAVVDTLSDDFVPVFYDSERDAENAAKSEENRWTRLVAGSVLSAAST